MADSVLFKNLDKAELEPWSTEKDKQRIIGLTSMQATDVVGWKLLKMASFLTNEAHDKINASVISLASELDKANDNTGRVISSKVVNETVFSSWWNMNRKNIIEVVGHIQKGTDC